MVRDGVFSDEVWAVVEPVLPSSKGRAGRPWTDHRRALEGIAWRYRTGSPWRDLPVEFGPWQTVWERHFRWSQDGTYQRIFDAVHLAGLLQQSVDPELEQLLSVDSTVVRAHQHAAGARRSSIGAPGPVRPPPRTQGAPSNYTNLPVEPADQAIGRSRGGLSTKIHTLTDDRTRPVAVILTPGQSGDNPQLEPLLDLHRQQYPLARRPHFRLLADKAYSHPSTREKLRGRRIAHTIPERQDQKDRRKAKGTKGGRPPGFDQDDLRQTQHR